MLASYLSLPSATLLYRPAPVQCSRTLLWFGDSRCGVWVHWVIIPGAAIFDHWPMTDVFPSHPWDNWDILKKLRLLIVLRTKMVNVSDHRPWWCICQYTEQLVHETHWWICQSISRYLYLYEKLHFFGEDPDRPEEDDEGIPHKKTQQIITKVPMIYNYRQHHIPGWYFSILFQCQIAGTFNSLLMRGDLKNGKEIQTNKHFDSFFLRTRYENKKNGNSV